MQNRNKFVYSIISLLVLFLVGFYVYSSSTTTAPVVINNEIKQEIPATTSNTNEPTTEENNNQNTNQEVAEPLEEGRFSGEEDIMPMETQFYEVTYDGTNYSPASITISNGDVINFKNNSDKNFWPASNPHPQHTDYPEFDIKSSLKPGESFSFKFLKTGTWKFHDHINPSASGIITVQ